MNETENFASESVNLLVNSLFWIYTWIKMNFTEQWNDVLWGLRRTTGADLYNKMAYTNERNVFQCNRPKCSCSLLRDRYWMNKETVDRNLPSDPTNIPFERVKRNVNSWHFLKLQWGINKSLIEMIQRTHADYWSYLFIFPQQQLRDRSRAPIHFPPDRNSPPHHSNVKPSMSV